MTTAVPVVTADGDLAIAVTRFCRVLRSFGLRIAPDAGLIALQALAAVQIKRRYEFQLALRIALLKRPQDIQLFNFLFNAYWSGGGTQRTAANGGLAKPAAAAGESEATDDLEAIFSFSAIHQEAGTATPADDMPLLMQAAPSGVSSPDVMRLERASRAELERLARALARRLATRPSRRRVIADQGHALAFGATLRRSLRYGGLPLELRWRQARPERARLIVFCDVSRSMRPYSQLLLQFASAVLSKLWQVEVFVFASELKRITNELHSHDTAIPDCGGGTQIGACINRALADYPLRLSRGDTFVAILSDGLDAGEPALLAEIMRQLRTQSRAIFWLNPLLRIAGYEPTARGMAAALPFIDVFASAHDLASLWQWVERLDDALSKPKISAYVAD